MINLYGSRRTVFLLVIFFSFSSFFSFVQADDISKFFTTSPGLAGDVEKGKTKAELCAGCHGMNGVSVSPIIPNLAGQKEEYLISSIKAFKSGARKNGMMASVVDHIGEDDIDDIAAYYARLRSE